MIQSNKGQTTIEMIVVIALILLIFSLALITANQKAIESNDFKLQLDAKRYARSIADNINSVAEQGPGYYRFFSLPAYLFGGEDYNVTIYSNIVEVNWSNRHGYQAYTTQIVTANASKYCLEKGGAGQTKVFNYDGRVFLTCDRADLLVDSFELSDSSISFDVFNYGSKETGAFVVNMTMYSAPGVLAWESLENMGGMAPDSREEVSWTFPAMPAGQYNLSIYADSGNDVSESFKGDNWYNVSFELS